MNTHAVLIEALQKQDFAGAEALLKQGVVMPTNAEHYFFILMSFVSDNNINGIVWLLCHCPIAKEFSGSLLTIGFGEHNWPLVAKVRECCPDARLGASLLIDLHQKNAFNPKSALAYVKKTDPELASQFLPIYFILTGQHPLGHLNELPKWMRGCAISNMSANS